MTRLLQALSAEAGELVSVGRFGIDGEKARDKLRLYQLADPRAWVLLVVEAVVLAGASKVVFEFDADDVRIACDGVRLGAAELEDMLGVLFVDIDLDERSADERLRLRVRQQLAFAINAALALEPRFIRFDSGPSAVELQRAELEWAQAKLAWTQARLARAQAEVDRAAAEVDRARAGAGSTGEGAVEQAGPIEPPSKPVVWGHRLELRPNAPDRLEQAAITDELRIHVRQRLRPGTVLDFFSARTDKLPEQRKLIDACRWSKVPILIGGRQVSRPPTLDRATVRASVSLDGEELGLAGIEWGAAAVGVVHMLGAGVLIESYEPEWALPGFVAIVDSRRLRRDISQTKLLRDAVWEAIVAAARSTHAELIVAVLEYHEPYEDEARTVWLDWLIRGGAAELEREPTLAPVGELELWETALGAGRSIAELAAGPRPIRYLRAERAPRLDFAGAKRFGEVVLAHDRSEAALQACFVANTLEIGGALAQARAFASGGGDGRFGELGQSAGGRLPGGGYVARELLGPDDRLDPGVEGEVGLRSVGAGPSWIRVVSLGRLLDVLPLDLGAAGLQAVIAGEFEPDASGGPARTELLGRSMMAILRASERLLDAAAERERARLGHHPVRALHRGWLHIVANPRGVLRALGFDEAVIEPCVAGLSDWTPLAATQLERRAHAAIRTFSRAKGEPIGFADLIAQRRAGESIHWLDESLHSLPVLDRNVLILAPADVALLERVFGRENLIPYEERVEWLRRREEFLAGPKQRPRLPEGVSVPVEIVGRGQLRAGFGLGSGARDDPARIEVFVAGRPLGPIELALGVPGLIGWVEGSDELEIAEDFCGLADLSPVIELAVAGVVALLERSFAEADGAGFATLWDAALRLAVAGAPGFAMLRALEDQADALARVSEIVGLLERMPRHVWTAAVELTLLEGVRPSVAAVRERARESSLRPDLGELARVRLRTKLAESGCLLELHRRAFASAATQALDEGSRSEPAIELFESPAITVEPAPAPALAIEAPEGAWIVEELVHDQASGVLWLGPEPPRLRLGSGDRVDAVLDSIDGASLPIAGALRGPSLALEHGRLPAPLRAHLRARARAMWSALVERHASDPTWNAEVGAALVATLLRFPESDDAAANEHAALLERLASLRLFELHDGSRISAAVAVRERPAELEHLGLAARLAGLAGTPVSPAPAQSVEPTPDPTATPSEAELDGPEAWLLAALRAELSLVRGSHLELLADAQLDSLLLRNIALEPTGKRRRPLFEQRRGLVVIDSAHPLVENLLTTRDPTLLSLLASAVYSFLNLIHASIEDHHEQRFASSHAAHVLSRQPRSA